MYSTARRLATNLQTARRPTCRKPFEVPEKVNIVRLLRLVARSPGRVLDPLVECSHYKIAGAVLLKFFPHTSRAPSQKCVKVPCPPSAQNKTSGPGGARGWHGIPQNSTEAARLCRRSCTRDMPEGSAASRGCTSLARGSHRTPPRRRGCTASPLTRGTPEGRACLERCTRMARRSRRTTLRRRGVQYRFAADQGHPGELCSLGRMHEDVTGVPQAPSRRRGCAGSPPTRGTLWRSVTSGCCSAWARGSRTLDTEAARLTKLACDQGHQGCPRMRTKCDTTICRSPKKPKTKTKNLDPFKFMRRLGSHARRGLAAAAHLTGSLGTVVKPTKPLAAGSTARPRAYRSPGLTLAWRRGTHAGASSDVNSAPFITMVVPINHPTTVPPPPTPHWRVSL